MYRCSGVVVSQCTNFKGSEIASSGGPMVISCTSSGIINYTKLAFSCHIIGHLFLEFGCLTLLEPIYGLLTSLVSRSFNLKRLIFIYSLQWF